MDWTERDRYGRIIGKIIHQGEDINLEMIRCGSRKLIGGTIGGTWTHWGHVDHSERTWLVREGAIGSEKGPMEMNRCDAGGLALPGKAALPMKEAG